MTGDWVYGAIPVLSVFHLLALAYAYRNRPGDGGKAPGENASAVGEEGAKHSHGGDVQCPECGAVSARCYRFCRRCVAEFPVGKSVLDQSAQSESRRTL